LKESRRIVITDKVFAAADLRRLAAIFEKQKTLAKGTQQHCNISFSIAFENHLSRETDSSEIFSDEGLSLSSRATDVEMSFSNYTLERWVALRLTHGNHSSGNTATVSGNDARWLSEAFLALQEAIAQVPPQKVWFAKHYRLLVNINAILIGFSGDAAMGMIIKMFMHWSHPARPVLPAWIEQIHALPSSILIPVSIMWKWLLGQFWGAFSLTNWIVTLWPSVEFDFGLEHLKTEKIKRKRLVIVMTLIVLPFLISELVDVINK